MKIHLDVHTDSDNSTCAPSVAFENIGQYISIELQNPSREVRVNMTELQQAIQTLFIVGKSK